MRAVVTGATGTVGKACATALARRGCRLSLVGRRPDALAAVADELTTDEERPEIVIADQRAGSGFDPPDHWRSDRLLLVNAAAIFGPLAPFAEVDLADWTETVAVNFLSPAALIRSLLPGMVELDWGRIVQVSSAAARDRPGPFNSAYAVSKSALDRLLAQVATEVAGTGVTVCCLHPGEINSAMRDVIAELSEADQRLSGWSSWAARTAAAGDDVEVTAAWVAQLLDDEFAAATHGRFGYPQTGRSEPL